MNHIIRWKRNTRLMWTLWAIWMIVLLSSISNYYGLPVEPVNADPMPFTHMSLGCITDSKCEGLVPAQPAQSDNINLSFKKEE